MPFPNARVIPERWAEHHRPTAESTMNTPATFHRSSGPAPYPVPPGWTGLELLWSTKVRVQALTNIRQPAEAGEQTVTTRRYLVTAPVDGPPLQAGPEGDQVHVLGRRLRIVDLSPGSNLWEADLVCEESLSQAGAVPLVEEAPDGDGE